MMMMMIKLTMSSDRRPIWINTSHIQCFREADTETVVYFSGSAENFAYVAESPDEILKLMNALETYKYPQFDKQRNTAMINETEHKLDKVRRRLNGLQAEINQKVRVNGHPDLVDSKVTIVRDLANIVEEIIVHIQNQENLCSSFKVSQKECVTLDSHTDQ